MTRPVSYTTVSIGEIVNRLDPKRLTSPDVEYVFGNRTFSREQTQPGQTYAWIDRITEEERKMMASFGGEL